MKSFIKSEPTTYLKFDGGGGINPADLDTEITDSATSAPLTTAIKKYVDDKETKVSKKEDNLITTEDDGIYVGPIDTETKVSEADNNAIEVKDDGIYVAKKSGGAIDISEETGNRIFEKDDGLYCPAIVEEDLTLVDGNLPTEEQMQEFLDDMEANYIRTDMLTEFAGAIPTQEEIVELTRELEKQYVTVDNLIETSPEQVGKTYELTEEHMTAATFNGKPVYEIAINGKSGSALKAWNNFYDMTPHNADKVLSIYGMVNNYIAIPWGQAASNGYYQYMGFYNGFIVEQHGVSGYNDQDVTVIVKYTKTTD